MTKNELLSAWPLLLGWPAIFLAVALAVAAVYRMKWLPAIFAAVLILPLTIYLVGSPRVGWLGALPITLLALLAIWVASKHGDH